MSYFTEGCRRVLRHLVPGEEYMLFRYEITMRLARTVLIIAAAVCLLASASLLFAAEAPKTRKGLVTVDVKLNAPADAKHVRVWIPYPVSDADQAISDVSVTGNFTKKSVSRDPENGSSIL